MIVDCPKPKEKLYGSSRRNFSPNYEKSNANMYIFLSKLIYSHIFPTKMSGVPENETWSVLILPKSSHKKQSQAQFWLEILRWLWAKFELWDANVKVSRKFSHPVLDVKCIF